MLELQLHVDLMPELQPHIDLMSELQLCVDIMPALQLHVDIAPELQLHVDIKPELQLCVNTELELHVNMCHPEHKLSHITQVFFQVPMDVLPPRKHKLSVTVNISFTGLHGCLITQNPTRSPSHHIATLDISLLLSAKVTTVLGQPEIVSTPLTLDFLPAFYVHNTEVHLTTVSPLSSIRVSSSSKVIQDIQVSIFSKVIFNIQVFSKVI